MKNQPEGQRTAFDFLPEQDKAKLKAVAQELVAILSRVGQYSEPIGIIKGLTIVKAWARQNAAKISLNEDRFAAVWSVAKTALADIYRDEVVHLYKNRAWEYLGCALRKKRPDIKAATSRFASAAHTIQPNIMKPHHVATINEFIFPAIFDKVRIERLPFNVRTKYTLKRYGVFRLSQLRGIKPRDLLLKPSCGKKTINDIINTLKHLSEVLPNQAVYNLPASLQDVGDFCFPRIFDDVSIGNISFSVRTHNVLRNMDIMKIAQLRGVRISDLLAQRNCGQKTVRDIVNTLREITGSDVLTSTNNASQKAMAVEINVANFAKEWDLTMFQLPVRILNYFKRKNVYLLKNIEGIKFDALYKEKGLGNKTVEALRQFIARVNRGDFGTTLSPEVEPRIFSELVDQYIRQLNHREKGILEQRYGARGGEGLTLEAIGSAFKVTRERIRQLCAKHICIFRRCHGLIIPRIGEKLMCHVREVNAPTQWAWIAYASHAYDYEPQFYLRILNEVFPTMRIALLQGQFHCAPIPTDTPPLVVPKVCRD